MRFRLRRDRDADPAADAAIVTYSRLPPRSDRWADPDRREPVLEAEEVPLARGDFRVDRSHRAVPAFDNDDTPERPRRRRTGRGVAILGALAFAVGVMILAYAYGLATRLDGPAAPASASLGTPVTPDATLTSGSAVVDTGDGVRRISPDSGSPAAAEPAATTTAALPPSGAVVQPSSASPPAPRERPAPATEQANAPQPSSENGLPMDGEFAAPASGQPAIVAPVPATTTPPAPAAAASTPKTAATPKSDAGSGDLMSNIELLLKRDGATAGAPDQPAGGGAAPAGPAPLGTLADAPPLPDPNAPATDLTAPPADIGPQRPGLLLPPADIPNVPPSNGAQ